MAHHGRFSRLHDERHCIPIYVCGPRHLRNTPKVRRMIDEARANNYRIHGLPSRVEHVGRK